MSAPDIGNQHTGIQLLANPFEGGQPLCDQVRVVAGPEKPLAAVMDVVYVLMPAESLASERSLSDLRRVEHRSESDLEEPGQVRRTA